MTTTDTTRPAGFDPFEIDWNTARTEGPATGPVVPAPAPTGHPVNGQPAGCSQCGARVDVGQGTVLPLGARTTVRCRRCYPRPDLAPAFVAPPVAASPAAALIAPEPVIAPAPAPVAPVVDPVAVGHAAAAALPPVRWERCPEPGRVALVSPRVVDRAADRARRDAIKAIAGGVWHPEHGDTGAWYVLAAHAAELRPTLRRHHGTDGGPLPGAPVQSAATLPPPGTAIAAAEAAPPPAGTIAAARAAAVDGLRTLQAEAPELAAGLADAVSTGAAMAATAHLVRGGVLPEDVRGVGVTAGARAGLLVAQERSAAAIGGTTDSDGTRVLPPPPAVTTVQPAFTGPVRTGTGISPAFAAAVEANRARQGTLQRSAVPVQVPATPTANRTAATTETREIRAGITAGEVVAGAEAEASGALIGWSGRRERTRAQLADVLAAAQLPAEWLPASKSARAHAGRAVDAANAWTWGESRLVARTANGLRDDARNGVVARWTLSTTRARTGEVGEAAGQIILTVELVKGRHDTYSIRWTGEPELGNKVQAEYARLASAEVYKAADVTAWLASVLKNKLGAVDFGPGSLYVRRGEVAEAERLCEELKAQGWGERWLLPALPVATSAQLRTGLVRAFADEAAEVTHRARALLKAAREKGGEVIGAGAAESLRRDLLTVQERAGAYAALLGDAALTTVRADIAGAISQVDDLCNPTTARAFMLELD